jgi:hypothetical protein
MSADLTYTVVATIQSKTPGEQPVEMKWYTGTSPVAVMIAVGQNLEHGQNSDHPFDPLLRSVTITVTEPDQ